MGTHYQHLCSEERNFIQRSLNQGLSLSAIADSMGRSRVTLWREIRRNALKREAYDASSAASASRARRRRGLTKLREGTALHAYVFGQIRLAWSPQQISGRLKVMNDPDLPPVSHESINPRDSEHLHAKACPREGGGGHHFA